MSVAVKKKQIILILTDRYDQAVAKLYSDIAHAVNGQYSVVLLYHQKPGCGSDIPPHVNCETFTDSVLHELGYRPLRNALLPGSNHFPVLAYFLKHPQYIHYWCIENDVVFNGRWSHFFDAFQKDPGDFVSSYLEFYHRAENWHWWSSLKGPENLETHRLIKSFNPIYRLSHKALKALDHHLKHGWSGHHEVLIPTLLYRDKLTLSDLNGASEVSGHEIIRRQFYTEDTFRYRPVFVEIGNLSNHLYHPVKYQKSAIECRISICVVCCNRTEHLSATLLANIADNDRYSNLEFILLNYNSADHLEDWVRENLSIYIDTGRLNYYKTFEPETFHHSHAKNLAFKLATGQIVCSINADHFTGPKFAEKVNSFFSVKQNSVLTPIPKLNSQFIKYSKDVFGKVCVKRDDFLKVTGFDERMSGYGFEDFDFINRLEFQGIKRYNGAWFADAGFIAHDEGRYSLGETYTDLNRILIRQISPSLSEVVFLYNNSKFEMGRIVNKMITGHEHYSRAYRRRRFDFEFDNEAGCWLTGDWKTVLNGNVLQLRPHQNEEFVIHVAEDLYTSANSTDSSTFFEMKNQSMIEDLLSYNYQFKNRIILQNNKATNVINPNKAGFGRAIVFKNFDYLTPITVS